MAGNLDIVIERRALKNLTPLAENAHYMDKREFDQLVSNIKRDGVLTSLPVIYDGDVSGEILSGNHRVKAALMAGIEFADVIVIKSHLEKQQKIAIQLSHNSIHGKDDPNILSKLFGELLDLDFKEYSGLTDESFKVSEVELVPLSFAQPEMETLTIVFLKADRAVFEREKDGIEKSAKKNEVWLADVKDFSAFHEAVFKAKTEYGIINTALAVKVMAKLALERFAELEAEDGTDS